MISVAGLHTVGMTALNGNLLARQNDQAAALAAQKIENIKQSGYDAATTGTTTESNLNAQGNTPGPFARTTAITAGPIANTKQLQVSVTWNNQAARTLTLTSLITSAG
ncbi:MAG: hypothetical protein HY699_20830 [Deltaproteobacteria bacterium]|nr:hypothetical protein [Deltaproteobacteria bacterium]